MSAATGTVGQAPDLRQYNLRSLREDLHVQPGPRTADGAATWTILDPVRDRYFRIGWLEYEFLRRWRRRRVGDVVDEVNDETPLHATPENVMALEAFLDQNQLLRRVDERGVQRLVALRDGMRKAKKRMALQRLMFFRFPLVKPDRFLSRTLPYIRFIFTRTFAMLLVGLALAGLILASRQWDAFRNSFLYIFTWEGMALFGVAVFLTKCVHELGHAYTAKYLGLRVPTIGFALLVMWPVLYTDTSHSWRLRSHRQRLAIGIAGVTAELGLAAIATFVWNFIPDGALRNVVFFIAAVSWILTLTVNLNPFMRWDGYYVLSDLLGVENLQQRAFNLGKWRLREWLWGFGDPPPERFPARRQRVLIMYSYATWGYRLLLFSGIALVAYHFFFKVIGLVMLLVVFQSFVLTPVIKETYLWWRRRSEVPLRRALVNSLIPISLILLLFVPWSTSFTAPALMKPRTYTRLYTPVAAQIRKVEVRNGQSVRNGDILFTLESPSLEYELRQNELRVATLQIQMARLGTADAYLERWHVLEQQLAEALAAYDGTRKELQRLVVRAPFDGVVVDVADNLTPGRWMRADAKLSGIIEPGKNEVIAYVDEANLGRIRVGGRGVFYPGEPELARVDLAIEEFDRTNMKVLDEPYNASVFGGSIPVQKSSRGELVPQESVYRLRLKPVDAGAISLPRIMRGEVRLQAESVSLIKRIWHAISAVIIRESGF